MNNAPPQQQVQINIGRIGSHVVQLIHVKGQAPLQIPMGPAVAMQIATQLMVQAAECVGELVHDEDVANACMDCQVTLARKRKEKVESNEEAKKSLPRIVK